MKITVQHFGVRSTADLDSAVEEGILALQTRLEIEEARVRLAWSALESPAFSVRMHLVTPGPDLEVAEEDHTLRAALCKAFAALDQEIKARSHRRRRRLRDNQQTPPLSRPVRSGARAA
jgi:ribosome-associated translation inhibitor RaiA